jgi:hypothetical protein
MEGEQVQQRFLACDSRSRFSSDVAVAAPLAPPVDEVPMAPLRAEEEPHRCPCRLPDRTVKRVFPWTRSSSCETPVPPDRGFCRFSGVRRSRPFCIPIVPPHLATQRSYALHTHAREVPLLDVPRIPARNLRGADPWLTRFLFREFPELTPARRVGAFHSGGRPARQNTPVPFPKGTPESMDRFLFP